MFKNKSVIITGGSKGIGLAIAKVFARETDHPLVLMARSEDELLQAKDVCLKEGAAKVFMVAADITNEEVISSIDFEQFNPAILINNAGSFLFKKLEETSVREFRSQFEVNAFGAFNLTKKLLPELRKSSRALIVNICSVGALEGLKDSGTYSMSKHALLGYSRSLRKELMGTNIAVTAVNLGQTYSTSWKEVDIDPYELIDPEDVGRLIISLTKLSIRSVADEIILTPKDGKVDPM